MDTNFKTNWLAALRGTQFSQYRGGLCGVGDTHLCCIGVGYAVAHPADDIGNLDTDTAAKRIGLSTEQRELLVHMNDDERKSFAEIADYIEKNL